MRPDTWGSNGLRYTEGLIHEDHKTKGEKAGRPQGKLPKAIRLGRQRNGTQPVPAQGTWSMGKIRSRPIHNEGSEKKVRSVEGPEGMNDEELRRIYLDRVTEQGTPGWVGPCASLASTQPYRSLDMASED